MEDRRSEAMASYLVEFIIVRATKSQVKHTVHMTADFVDGEKS
jgi:hypothetical protein